ncbi:MAG: helix-turn-helix transcriptional regulator [Coriobacteriales bacterium]|nr:helix-turn-helix transcriptional regulator [Coriobacteriales bacterium]
MHRDEKEGTKMEDIQAIVHCDADESEAVLLEGMPEEELLYDLADLFKVFADTTRIKVLYALMGKSLCVAHIAQAVGASQSAVSHQLRVLKQAHLVRFTRDGKNVIYSLADDHVYTILSQGMNHICE